jgi:hypothetical protein
VQIRLWRYQTKNKHPDIDAFWYFWQPSAPYKLNGVFAGDLVEDDKFCEVYSLGHKDLLFSGVLRDVPVRLRCYLSEVRVISHPPRLAN